MNVSAEILNCAAYIGLRLADGSFHFGGSAFFLDYLHPETGSKEVYLVTARHVIDKIRAKGVEHVCVRLNRKDGPARWFGTLVRDWFVDPDNASTDAAILRCTIGSSVDHIAFPRLPRLSDGSEPQYEITLGDEVFMIGLFRDYRGPERNIPIVRVGNFACFVEGTVLPTGARHFDKFLIEVRSIGGLSGSPVFLHVNRSRLWNRSGLPEIGIYNWLGLLQGHYASQRKAKTIENDDTNIDINDERINAGIALAEPCQKVDAIVAAFRLQFESGTRRCVAFFTNANDVPNNYVGAILFEGW
jgi:hypothetical protein